MAKLSFQSPNGQCESAEDNKALTLTQSTDPSQFPILIFSS